MMAGQDQSTGRTQDALVYRGNRGSVRVPAVPLFLVQKDLPSRGIAPDNVIQATGGNGARLGHVLLMRSRLHWVYFANEAPVP